LKKSTRRTHLKVNLCKRRDPHRKDFEKIAVHLDFMINATRKDETLSLFVREEMDRILTIGKFWGRKMDVATSRTERKLLVSRNIHPDKSTSWEEG